MLSHLEWGKDANFKLSTATSMFSKQLISERMCLYHSLTGPKLLILQPSTLLSWEYPSYQFPCRVHNLSTHLHSRIYTRLAERVTTRAETCQICTLVSKQWISLTSLHSWNRKCFSTSWCIFFLILWTH